MPMKSYVQLHEDKKQLANYEIIAMWVYQYIYSIQQKTLMLTFKQYRFTEVSISKWHQIITSNYFSMIQKVDQ